MHVFLWSSFTSESNRAVFKIKKLYINDKNYHDYNYNNSKLRISKKFLRYTFKVGVFFYRVFIAVSLQGLG